MLVDDDQPIVHLGVDRLLEGTSTNQMCTAQQLRQAPNSLNEIVVAPRPHQAWRAKPNTAGRGRSVSRVRENRTHGSTGGDWKRNTYGVTAPAPLTPVASG